MQDFLKINDNDNVVVALNTIPAGEKITVSVGDGSKTVTAREEIPAGHKMAIFDIPEGGEVIKYGYRIGNAKENITEGSWIHTHNVKTALGDLLEYTYNPTPVEEKKTEDVTFMGFNRPDGKVGVRNEIWVIPTVGCVNNVATAIAKQANAFVKGSVEEVIAFPHPYGCSQMGDDQEHTRKILADLINHPNAGGVLVLGLGCENSNIDVLKPYIGDYDENRVKFLVCQEHEDEIADSVEVIKGLIDYASKFEREPISVSKLVIGMKCGGSDGLSGITANPLVGRFSDLLISKGGTTILTEVPEMFGAETILMNRCANEELFHQTVDLINDFKNYFKSHNQTIYENPSPGNKKGGISTLEDKSLGCTQKSGSALVRGVLQYGDTVKCVVPDSAQQ
jgi:altronate hydrolase